MSPLKSHDGWGRVNLDGFPSEAGAKRLLESEMGLVAASILGGVVLAFTNKSVVGTNLDHLFRVGPAASVGGELVNLVVNGTPIFGTDLVRGLLFPVLDQVLYEVFEGASFVVGSTFFGFQDKVRTLEDVETQKKLIYYCTSFIQSIGLFIVWRFAISPFNTLIAQDSVFIEHIIGNGHDEYTRM